MIHNLKKTFAILSMMVFGGMLVYNCEPDADSLGEQLFLGGATDGDESLHDLIAYNIDNNDTIRTDATKLYNTYGSTTTTSSTAVLGAFREEQFGMQRASYFTQVRLAANNPDFGTNPTVDSVVLVIKPLYVPDSITTTTNEDYIYPDGDIAAKKVVSTYPAVKYGRTKKDGGKLTIQVKEVTDFMKGANDVVYSDHEYGASQILGERDFFGKVSSVVITKDSDASEAFKSNIGYRIPLSPSFFKTKIIDKEGQPELSDVSNFIRYFRGIKISVTQDDGYLFPFYNDDMEMIMYYKNDQVVDGNTTRPQSKYSFSMGSANAHSAYYEYDRAGAGIESFALGNKNTGDETLYAQGMGGNSIAIRFPAQTINDLKLKYNKDKAAIIGAKIRIYTDEVKWANPYAKPTTNFTIVQRTKGSPYENLDFTADYTSLGSTFIPVKAYDTDKNPAYYEFSVTQTLKNIVESSEPYVDDQEKYLKIDLASFVPSVSSSGTTLVGAKYTTRATSYARAVFVGSDPNNANRIKLRVTYGKKKN